MGTLFYIIGAILKAHPPDIDATNPALASRVTASLLYIYACFYSWGWGPLPWVYVSEIFPTRTRHYGLTTGIASHWLWSKSCGDFHSVPHPPHTGFCRFHRDKIHTPNNFQPRLQNLCNVRDCQHRSYGYFFIVRQGMLPSSAGKLTVLYDIASFLRPRAGVWRRWISSLGRSPQMNAMPILSEVSPMWW